MAFGDPMMLATLYNGGVNDTNHDSLLIDGPMDDGAPGDWSWDADVATPTISNQFGTRTGGAGSQFHRLTFTTPGTGVLGYYRQVVTLRGHNRLGNYGHQGEVIYAQMHAKRNDATSGTVTATVQITETVAGVSSGPPQAGMATGTWYNLSAQRTIAALSNTFEIRIKLEYGGGGGSPVIDVDEAALYLSYTFAVNAAMPDRPRLIAPGRAFQRTPGGVLVAHRSGALDCNKYEYTLNFGNIGLAQVKSLRSLWLTDAPMRWTPNLPHLPTYIDVRFSGGFDIQMKSPSVNSNNFHGSLTLAEI